MAAVAVAIAVVLAVTLVVRERMWRRAHATLRSRIADSAAQLRQQEQRANVSQVVSGLAQELKSPLQGVLGSTEVMLASGDLHPSSEADLREIQDNAVRAAGIVRNLVAFTETHALSRRWHDINSLTSRAAETVKGEPGTLRFPVMLVLADRLPLIYVDGRQLEKVIATLLARPSFDGGAPRDNLAAVVAAPLTVTTRLSTESDRVIIELDDRSGEFDTPAWSGDLAACREIVQAHGGTLEVVRRDNASFRFQVELPVTAPGAEAPLI